MISLVVITSCSHISTGRVATCEDERTNHTGSRWSSFIEPEYARSRHLFKVGESPRTSTFANRARRTSFANSANPDERVPSLGRCDSRRCLKSDSLIPWQLASDNNELLSYVDRERSSLSSRTIETRAQSKTCQILACACGTRSKLWSDVRYTLLLSSRTVRIRVLSNLGEYPRTSTFSDVARRTSPANSANPDEEGRRRRETIHDDISRMDSSIPSNLNSNQLSSRPLSPHSFYPRDIARRLISTSAQLAFLVSHSRIG